MSLKVAATVAAVASALVLSSCAASPPRSTGTSDSSAAGTTELETSGPTSAGATTTASPQTRTTEPTSAARTGTSSSLHPPGPVVPRPGHAAWVSVTVATLWRAPSSPRAVDLPALRSPADIRGWLHAMTLGDRRGLQGRADTQALLGDRVLVTAVRGTWAKVVVPDQPTPLDASGYPGWLPIRQLSAVAPPSTAEAATVVARTAWLRADTARADKLVEVSYGTRLPVLGAVGGRLRVGLPGGVVRRLDPAAVARSGVPATAISGTGAAIVRSAQSFTGLPYLWAGRSGFGFDCSGLTSLVYRVHGVVIPRDADAQAVRGRWVPSGATSPGDLLFYATASGYVHHVSVYAGSGRMVQSPATGQSVQTIPVATASYAAQFAGARRYLP